jgi:hypothetical protein
MGVPSPRATPPDHVARGATRRARDEDDDDDARIPLARLASVAAVNVHPGETCGAAPIRVVLQNAEPRASSRRPSILDARARHARDDDETFDESTCARPIAPPRRRRRATRRDD